MTPLFEMGIWENIMGHQRFVTHEKGPCQSDFHGCKQDRWCFSQVDSDCTIFYIFLKIKRMHVAVTQWQTTEKVTVLLLVSTQERTNR